MDLEGAVHVNGASVRLNIDSMIVGRSMLMCNLIHVYIPQVERSMVEIEKFPTMLGK